MNYLLEEVMQERDRLRREREAAVAILRIECAAYDDNDWPDNLHLADIIEKHLAKSAYVEARAVRREVVRLRGWLDLIANDDGEAAHLYRVWADKALSGEAL